MDQPINQAVVSTKLTTGAWLMIGITFISVALSIWLLIPQAMSIPDLNNEIAAAEQKLEETNNKLLLLDSYDERLLQDRLDNLLATALPTEFDLPQLFNAIIVTAEEQGFELEEAETIETNRKSIGSGVNLATMELNFTGDPTNFETFAQNIKQLSPVVKIANLEFTTYEDAPTKLSMTFETYIFDRSNIKPIRVETSEVPKFGAKDDEILSTIQDLQYIPLNEANTISDPLRDPFGAE